MLTDLSNQEDMFNALQEEEYSAWELRSLSIYSNTRAAPDRRLASAIRRRVPSVQTLFSMSVELRPIFTCLNQYDISPPLIRSS